MSDSFESNGEWKCLIVVDRSLDIQSSFSGRVILMCKLYLKQAFQLLRNGQWNQSCFLQNITCCKSRDAMVSCFFFLPLDSMSSWKGLCLNLLLPWGCQCGLTLPWKDVHFTSRKRIIDTRHGPLSTVWHIIEWWTFLTGYKPQKKFCFQNIPWHLPEYVMAIF